MKGGRIKKTAVLIFAGVLIFGGFFSLSAQQHSDDTVLEAMSVSMGAYFMAAMMAGMGNAPEGVSFDPETGNMKFTAFDVTEMSEAYSSISGDVEGSETEGFDFDFSLSGGPVSTVRYTLTQQQMQNQPEEMVIYADGSKYVLPLEGTKQMQ